MGSRRVCALCIIPTKPREYRKNHDDARTSENRVELKKTTR